MNEKLIKSKNNPFYKKLKKIYSNSSFRKNQNQTILDGPQGNWVSEHFDEPEEAVEAVRALHEAGAICVKVYHTLQANVFLAIRP